MAQRDPGFCHLAKRCARAAVAAPLRCHADGSVSRAGVRLAATTPCDWRASAGAVALAAGGDDACPAAVMLRRVASGVCTIELHPTSRKV